jgi:hypothetical protein
MKLQVHRYTVVIIPESEQDIAFLEDTLGMKEDGDLIKLERVDTHSSGQVEFRLESFVPYGDLVHDSDINNDDYENKSIHETSPYNVQEINLEKYENIDSFHESSKTSENPSITLINIEAPE